MAGAYAFNLGTPPVAVQEVADLIMELRPGAHITVEEKPLPFPEGCDPSPLHEAFQNIYETPLAGGIEQSIAHFQRLPASS